MMQRLSKLGGPRLLANMANIWRANRNNESGFTTAELLGNAALGVVALVIIWAALQALGLDVVNYIQAQMFKG